VFLAGVGVGYGTSELYDFAELSEYDASPLPRPKINAPFITTPNAIVEKMIEVGEISSEDLVYDLGCGDGRIVITAAVQRGCHGVGFDIDPKRVAEATENAEKHGVKDLVSIEEQDVFKVDLSKADVIVMYLLPWMLRDLKPSFDKCPDGTRLVSHDFEIEGVMPDKTVEFVDEEGSPHYVRLYVTPLKKLPPPPRRSRL
jgi:SAM-dependent methyltransferase